MKGFLLFACLIVAGVTHQVNAQVSSLARKYPYNVVIEKIRNPDTLLLCQCYTRNFYDNSGNKEVTIILYKETSEWYAILMTRNNDFGKSRWIISNPCFILSSCDMEEKWNLAKDELQNHNEGEWSSTIYTCIYMKENGYEVEKLVAGNVRDWFSEIPKVAYFYTLGLFATQGCGVDYRLWSDRSNQYR